MKSLIYLSSLKAKAYIRKILSKPTSAIFTILGILFFVGFYFLMNSSIKVEEKGNFELFSIIYLGCTIFMIIITLFQKRQALINIQDANFILVGPYDTRELLKYSLINSFGNALLYSFMTFVYAVCFFGPLFEVGFIDFIFLFINSYVLYLELFIFIDAIYLHFMTSKYQRIIRSSTFITIVLIIISVFIYFYINNNFNNLNEALFSFINSKELSYTPIFGWMHMAINNMHNMHYLLAFMGLGLNLLVLIVIIIYALSTKNIDPEVIISDATYFDDIKKKAKENNSNINLNLKVKDIKEYKFNTKAKAISSRMMLDMRKTNSFITRQEILFILLYFAIAYFSDYDFLWYSRYVTIILFMVTMSANYLDELKHHYIYLIPDPAAKKLIALIKPTIIKILIVVVVMNTVGIVFKPTIIEYIGAILETFGYGLLFVTGNILCTRILKSNENPVANQFIKMGIILVILIASIVIGIIFAAIFSYELYSFTSSIASILISFGILYLAKGIVSGVELNAD